VQVSGSSVRWSRWLDPPAIGESLEFDLPYGLVDLTVRLFPDSRGTGELAVQLDELGVVRTTRAALAEGTSSVLRDVLQASTGGPTPGRVFTRMAWTVREGIDLAGYTRWLRMFETPSSVAFEQVRARALSSGLRVSIVSGEETDRAEIEGQLPGRLEFVRSFGEARADIVVPLGAAVRLVPHALATLVCVFHRLPEVAMIHVDHDRFEAGRRTDPDFNPVLGPELLRSRNVLRALVAVRRDDAPVATEAALDDEGLYAWALSAAAAIPPRRIRRLPVVLATVGVTATSDPDGERRVLANHLRQAGVAAEVLPGLAPGLHHVRYRLRDPAPTVSIVVPTRNAHGLVETCVRSVRRLTHYPRYEIHLVDNGSDDPEALAAFDTLAKAGEVVLHRDPRPFNFSALNNAAVARADAELVCLLNNDVEALHPEWLEEMVSVALQPGVGAVGAKLFYPDGRVQHGGVLVGLHGAADHAYAGAPGDAPGYAQQLLVRREVSAVTAACLVIRRALYLEVGGLNEEAFGISFNDVDFCLKLRERGYRNVWTPHARLVHHESASRGKARRPEQKARADRELAALRFRWADALREDPYHSPNLSLDSKLPRLAWPPRERRPWSL